MLIILTLIYPFFRKKTVLVQGETIIKNNKYYIYFVSFMLAVILGLRGISIGIDTIAYYNSFNKIKNLSLFQALDVKVEPGYRLFEFIVGRVFGNYQYLLIIAAILYITVISYHIYKYSSNPMFSYLLFILFGFYTFALSTTRQIIAIGFVMIAFKYIKEKKIFKYMFFVILAFSFHMTAIIFLPCYWFNMFKLSKKTIILFISIALVVIGLKDDIRIFLINNSKNEYMPMETGGNKMYLFMLASVALGIVFRKQLIRNNDSNKYLFYMMVVSAILMPVTQFNPAVMRLYFYFFIFMIIYIPNLLIVIKDKAIRLICISGYTLIGIVWFFTSIIHIGQIDHYLFFWQ